MAFPFALNITIMNILELDSYNLADAVKFNDRLNPRLWGKDEHMLPEVRDHLLQIANDFREFLGVSGYDLKDITVSGSNAAYTYTPNSDVDLHLVVDLPEADASEVYRELFDAKKFQYNQQHNISIGGYPVELYVQDANKPHVSQGIYSVLNNKWIDVPKRRDAGVDDISIRSKYEDLSSRIDSAVDSGNYDDMSKLMNKIKTMRQTGLDQHGEFGAENIAFKMLRNQGVIKRLIDARNAARDQELSLREREVVVKKPFTYGFKTEDVGSSWDGVSPTTQMFLNEKPEASLTDIVSSFIDYCVEQLGIEQSPQVKFKKDPQWSARNKTFGRYNADHNLLEVSLAGRHVMDILRTVAHELTHTRQHEVEHVPDSAGATGSKWENEANAQAGVLMRDYAQQHPEFFNDGALEEGIRDKIAGAALAACVAGAPGCATTAPVSTAADAVKTAVRVSQLTRAGLEHGAKQELKNVLRRGANANESSGYIPTKKQARDPRFSMALTQDVRPGAIGREANKLNLKTDSQGQPDLLMKGLANALREFKETGKLPSRAAEDYSPDQPPGPESKPTMPKGTLRVDVSDVYDWYKLGQHISNLKGMGKHDFGKGPPSAIVSFGDEETEHQFIKDLEATGLDITDIDPRDPAQPPGMKKVKTDPTYNVDENFADGKNPQDKGDSARHGIPKKASISSLRKIAKQGGRKGQLAHWQANMRSGRAKANETIAESEQLLEINMSPSSLRTLAAQTGAIAGMEFEMIVPGIEGVEDEELEPNYDDYDENVTSIDDAANFFNDGDLNGSREIRRLRDSMSEDYQTWLGDAWMEHFETYKNTIVFRFGKENWEEAQLAEILGLDEAETEALETRGASPEDYMDAAEKVIADGLDPWLNDAQEDAKDEYYDDDHQDDWLASEGLNYMSDVERQYEISWPHWTSAGGDAGIESVADEFASAIGRKTNWSSSYHGGKREPNAYVVEPDGSLVPGDEDDAGLEFVSPPLPIDDMLSDLNKVKAWADERGCYTSKAAKTGLHINVSVPNFDAKKLDYVKLALLLGDQYVLEQFGRTGNQYAKSALDIVKTRVQERPGDAALLLNKMRDNLEALATKVIHTGETSKFTSINTKDGYIEFRSPGGDWLDENFAKIENTLLRFVVALDAAMDPEKYRDEYLKKLYKLLNPAGKKDAYGEMIQEFSKYMASLQGDASEASGKLNKETQQAILDFRRAAAAELAQTTAAPAGAAANYKIYSIPDGRIMDTFYAANQAAAEDQFRDWLMTPEAGASDNFRYAPLGTIIRGDTGSAAAPAPATNTLTPRGPGPWEIYRISDNASVREIGHTNRAAAETEARSALGLRGEAPELYGVRTRPGADAASNGIIDIEPDIEQYAVPGSTLDLQRQRQQAAQQAAATGTFRGTWAIKDSRGNTLHTFGGIGNSQSDANRVAAGWLARAGYQAGLEVEVVPVMEP